MDPILLITGGRRGIGAATALLAAQRGYAVADVADINLKFLMTYR